MLASQEYAKPILAGLSSHGHHKDRPYVTAGDRAYLIGTQDGNFPDLGDHVPGEMGGLWLHPIKLVDGFWASVTDDATGRRVALTESAEFINYPYGNRLRYGPVLDGVELERFQFSPDGQQGVIVQYIFNNAGDREKQVTLELAVKTDLRPVWFSDHVGIRDARDTVVWEASRRVFVAWDREHPWFAVWGAGPAPEARPVAHPQPIPTKGMGVTAASRYRLSVAPHAGSTLTFVIAGSATSRNDAVASYESLARNHARLLKRQEARYAAILERARVSIPDSALQQVYNWVKVNTQWLVRDVPGIGRGLGGGFMEYPWWFGTETYSLQALIASGDDELAKQTLRLLKSQSMKANGNGRIVHELTTQGVVFNPGNTQETAQFILTVGKLVQWTGDLAFAKEMYPTMELGLRWLLTDMDRNGDLFPEGYGIMEVSGLNAELIDVAVYTQQALEATARVADLLGQPAAAARYRRLASQLEAKIQERFWVPEEGSYGDFYGTRAQAIEATRGAIRQIRLGGTLSQRDSQLIADYERLAWKFAAMPDSARAWITNKNWVITTPMETGIAPRPRAIALLDRIRRENVGEYGPFLSAVERQAMMTIATGVQAVSEANYGRTDQALWYVGKIVQTFNRTLPGSISEMMPDYGCFTIAWTSYGIVVPLIQHVFGIQPDAPSRTVVLEPHVPAGWKHMSIEDLPLGADTVSFARAETAAGIEFEIRARQDGWTFVLKTGQSPGAKYYVNGRPVAFSPAGIRLSGRHNRVLVVP